MAQDIERAGQKETAEQMFVCDELSHLTDLLKVGLVGACANHKLHIIRPLQINLLSSVSKCGIVKNYKFCFCKRACP